MRIAVTYENGNVFPHFGKTEAFKLYEVENGTVLSCDIISTNGTGHEALAYMLADMDVNVLICGGMGQGAKDALEDAGIETISGASGNTDEVVQAYLKGELESAGINCDHHHGEEEEHSCGSGCGGCGGGCGGCGGCHSSAPAIEGPNAGKIVRVHYTGTFNDGTQFDSSYDRGEPLEFICGAGMMIPGFDKAVAVMEVGQKINVHLMPEEAYGPSDSNAVFTVKISELPGSETLEAGMRVGLTDVNGQQFPVTVAAKDEENITFDANHEMAGKELNFEIELIEVK